MIRLTQNDWRIFRRLQRKHKVSIEFLRYNLENIEKFIWFETWPRIVIRRYAIRKGNRVFIIYYRLRRVLFDQSNSKIFKRMRQNIKQWSKRIVAWQKNNLGITEYVEELVFEDKCKEKAEIVENIEITSATNEDVSRQLKQQLELLKNGRRPQPIITETNQNVGNEKKLSNKTLLANSMPDTHEEKQKSDSNNIDNVQKNNLAVRRTPQECDSQKKFEEPATSDTTRYWQNNLESTPEKQITTQENTQPVKQMDTDEKTENSQTVSSSQQTEKLKTGLNFLDMLMCKVSGSTVSNAKTSPDKTKQCLQQSSSKEPYQHHHEHSMDSTDEFLGFDDCERIPGMLMTPIVPLSTKNSKNSVFVSESLNEYMRINDLETNYSIDEDKSVPKAKIFARHMEGLMTPKTQPPAFDMPAVPENLLKFRTVAERKQYLQKFSKNFRLAIINNEASIYRELQRRMRTQKVKSASQLLTQSTNSSMSFTRNGWNAASFINTEFNKYYYQILNIDHGTFKVRLRGARGNNDEFNKTPYVSKVIKQHIQCPKNCSDDKVWQYLKPIRTIVEKTKKLNKGTLPSVFKPCPLSHKTFQKPLDDDTAALLLAGGSMAVVRMPTVELEVFPEYGKPLHEIAKRYLQYILPHHDISREWAEFSVSTLQQPKTLKEAEEAAAKSFNTQKLRKSYTFVIPYLNDRNHILVRRVVDRSEKLDKSFELCEEEKELVPKADFAFRKHLDLTDDVLQTCANVVSDMINTVAISCSENSFIKSDPDGLFMCEELKSGMMDDCKHDGQERAILSSANAAVVSGGFIKKPKKQNSLLLELKRLNATIIDAAVKPENDKKPCSKDYCQMGCICISLDEVAPIREHCGKTKCMIDCSCKPSNQSRIMRLETDGRTLTTEDAFMLRRKATARLARMEKEFTSTIVLTENETLLINETNNDKKRRCTKAPKRYEDFTDTEDERRNSPKKTGLTTIDKEKHLAVAIKEVYDPVYVKDSILEQLKHCTVSLVALQDMDNIAHWCMVHNLYKCFCKGRAVEGKPIVIEKELNTTIEHDVEQRIGSDYVSPKAKYTFDKMENKKRDEDRLFDKDKQSEYFEEEDKDVEQDQEDGDETDADDDDDDWIKERKHKYKEKKESNEIKKPEKILRQSKTVDDFEETVDKSYTRADASTPHTHTELQKTKRSLHDVRNRFYSQRLDSCRRHIPTPRRMFLYCNRRRRLNVLKYIKDNENDQTRLLLNEHVMRSVYYHKVDVDSHTKKDKSSSNEKINSIEKSSNQVIKSTQSAESVATNEPRQSKFLLVNEVVDLLEDEEETNTSNILNKNKDNNQGDCSTNTKSRSFEKLTSTTETAQSTNHFQICSTGGIITVKKFIPTANSTNIEKSDYNLPSTVTEQESVEMRKLVTETGAGADELRIPKIASCFSLNANANIQKPCTDAHPNEEQNLDFTSATSVHSAAFSQSQNQELKNVPTPIPTTATTTVSKAAGSAQKLDMDNENVRDVYNSVIKTMNTLVSRKMQDIDCALQRESHIIPTPNSDILCIMKWCNFLDAFCEGFAYIWQVKLKDHTYFVVTIQNVMPLIIGAMGIVNITALKAEKMPLMGKILLQRFRNRHTENLAIVMQGKQSHWVVKGFLKADPNMACNKPTPETHPSLTKKINVLCSLLVKQRQKEQKKKEKQASQCSSPLVNAPPQTLTALIQPPPQPPPQPLKIAQIMPTRRIVTIQPRPGPQIQNSSSILQLQPPTNQTITPQICQQKGTDAVQTSSINLVEIETAQDNTKKIYRKRKTDDIQSASLFKMDSYSKMSSNIEFRSVTQIDIDEIFLPELHKLDHKWLVLDLHNDFSHIFVPDFRDLVSLDRIQKVINFARQKSKIVKLQFFQNAPFDAFVTPKSVRKIYFGPLTMDMKAPTLILLQSVDGQMMLRELYQLQHNIAKTPEEKTKAFWLVHLKGQTHFEMDVKVINEKTRVETTVSNIPLTSENKKMIEVYPPESSNKTHNGAEEKNIDNDDDDEDCVIIEGPAENSSYIKDTNSNILPLSNSSTPSAISSIANNIDSSIPAMQTHSLHKMPNTKTIVKPLNTINKFPQMTATNKPLPILTLPPNTIITGINPHTPMANVAPTPIVAVPQTAIITGIQAAPPEAPYSSTIFITSSQSSSVTPFAATTTSTAAIGSTAITSSSLESNRQPTNELRSSCIKQPQNTVNNTLDACPIKRRRISLFCSNKYDKISENLAVDAVIRKILPNNAEDIQINQLSENSNGSLVTPAPGSVTDTMQVSKVASQTEANNLQTSLASAQNTNGKTTNSKAPIVFDVNFMDDGDEPTASIVIKPTSSTVSSSTTPTTTTPTSKPFPLKTKTLNSTRISAPVTAISTALNTSSTFTTCDNFTVPPNKKIKLPTLFNTTTAVANTSSNINATVKGKIINPILYKKQANIVPKISTPKTTSTSSSFNLSMPSEKNLITTTTPFPFRSPISLKVQKMVSSTVVPTLQAVKPITTTATITKKQPTVLTVKQVQDMLNKSRVNVGAINSSANPSPVSIASTNSMSLPLLPSIKATLTQAKPTVVSSTSTAITTASSTITSRGCVVSSTFAANPSASTSTTTATATIATTTPPVRETSSLNPTLTISKVQSFGAPQKPNNPDKNLPTLIGSPAQVVINDKPLTAAPPSHIQYGYIISSAHANQKFVAKRVADEFYVKVPSVGILKLQGLGAVNNYLNKFITKNLKETQTKPAVWQFIAASKAVQLQNHQKSLLVRKTKTTTSNSETYGNKTTCANNSFEETILIDD